MNLNQRIEAFVRLGTFLHQFGEGKLQINDPLNAIYLNSFNNLIKDIHVQNAWFTEKNVRLALKSIATNLSKDKIETWLKPYQIPETPAKRVGVVMAGNIPLVGFHDMLCVLISGHIFVGKASSKDDELIKFISDILLTIQPDFNNFILFEESKLSGIDAVIATGSNNSSKYFEYYFGKYPHVIRKNRNSIAILDGTETTEELKRLGDDIFSYFGLGCRSVSKIFVPKNYDFKSFFEAIEENNYIYAHNKYVNNYDYNKSVYLMNSTPHLDNGFVVLKGDTGFSSPIGTIYYENYVNEKELVDYIEVNKEKLQCVVCKKGLTENSVYFGDSQFPELWNYADNVDTIKFLINLK
jgi:hypothetical protein